MQLCPIWQVKFRADETDVELRDLMPSTDYSVTVYALYEDEPSDPVTAIATTCKCFKCLCTSYCICIY